MRREVIIVPGGTGSTGGLSIDVRNLATGLGGKGYDVTVAEPGPTDAALAGLVGVSVRALYSLPPRAISELFGLHTGLHRILRARPDAVVHAFGSTPSYLTLAALIGARRRGNPVVWTPMFHPLRQRAWRRRRLLAPMCVFDLIVPPLGRWADAVGAATEAEAKAFARAGVERVRLLPPVVESRPITSRTAARSFRRSIGADSSPLVVVVASRDEPRKGLAFGFRAFERLRTDVPDARLAVVGMRETPLGLPQNGVFVGRVDDQRLAAALRAANVVFVPSLFEAFSRVVIEAWQQATPVVVSDGVALAAAVEGGGGEVVAYGDTDAASRSLRAFLLDPIRARHEGQLGRKLVEEHFTLDVLIDDVTTLYDELLARTALPATAAGIEFA